MAFFGRQVLAISTAAILLLVQALPSLAVCVCGKETPMTCCSSPDGIKTEESGCACDRESRQDPRSHCERMTQKSGATTTKSMSGAACKKIDVGLNLNSTETPQGPEVFQPDQDGGVVVLPTQLELPDPDHRFPDQQMRGPPLGPPGHLYLFHCSFLL